MNNRPTLRAPNPSSSGPCNNCGDGCYPRPFWLVTCPAHHRSIAAATILFELNLLDRARIKRSLLKSEGRGTSHKGPPGPTLKKIVPQLGIQSIEDTGTKVFVSAIKVWNDIISISVGTSGPSAIRISFNSPRDFSIVKYMTGQCRVTSRKPIATSSRNNLSSSNWRVRKIDERPIAVPNS